MAMVLAAYLSPSEQTLGAVLGTVAAIGGTLAARLLQVDHIAMYFVVCLTPVVAALLGWRVWLSQNRIPMSRDEQEKQRAIDTLRTPLWQALLIHGTPSAIPLIMMTAWFSETVSDVAWFLAFSLLYAPLSAAVIIHFEQQRAQRLLGVTNQ